MTQEEVQQDIPEVVGAQAAEASEIVNPHPQSLAALEVLIKKRFIAVELENLLKKYFSTLQAIAEVECKFCDDENTECEHKLARQALDIEF